MRLSDVLWPTLERSEADVRRETQAQAADLTTIAAAAWPASAATHLSEARRIADREDERRLSTDAKASSYLLVIAALIPLLTYLESTVWDPKSGTAPKWLSLPILAVAVLYVLTAGIWSFRVLTVGVSHTLSATDLSRLATSTAVDADLTRETLLNARRNADSINRKVSCIKMGHIFLRRGIVFFGALLLVQIAWYAAARYAPDLLHRLDVFANSDGPVAANGVAGLRSADAAGCDEANRAARLATDELNGILGRHGLRGPPTYWLSLGSSRRAASREAGELWEVLRISHLLALRDACADGRTTWRQST